MSPSAKSSNESKRSRSKKKRQTATACLERRELLAALRALKRGEFTHRMRDDLVGEDGQICDVFNEIAQKAEEMEAELASAALAIGTEGRTQRRLAKNGATGGWANYVASVNEMLNDLTAHSNEVARVVTAVSKGDLTQRMQVEQDVNPLRGDFLTQARDVDLMVEQLSLLGSEVTRVAREVGVKGRLGAQAEVPNASGAWKELADNVNLMASNLTSQVREIARVTTAVAQGDLTKTVNIEVKGEILELKNTINTMVGQLSSFADEVTRVAREVGTEGRLGGQAQVRGVSGVWRDLTENVNSMADNLTSQVRNIADVTTAVANGDLSRKITVEVRGEILQLKNTINDMVDSLGSFADEVTRMAREVGTDGVLGGQAQVRDVSGVWKELTDNVNSMANNLTSQVRNISEVATAVANGDLSRKITVNARGEVLDLKNTINNMVDQLNAFGAEVTRVAREVGVEGKLGGQAEVEGVRGSWKELTDNVNLMASNLTNQVRDIAEVTTAVAQGDLTRKIVVDARGEILELKSTINTMVDQLSSFADEVTRLASDVGVEGKLGGQADVRGVSGTWRDLTDAVNSMASNLTDQVRSISQVATAIAEGDLREKIEVDARGEILELKNTINTMVDQLSSFAEEVTRVARDVGTEGKLGGQASVEGVRGTWKELTDNVNLMASNLTAQVRDISQVATAIAQGDLGRKITVAVRGELLELKNTINTMVDQLSSFADEVTRVARDVGVEGKLGGQADVRGVSGIWKELTDNVNLMASNLTDQVRDIAQVTTAVANGDLSSKITVEVRGEILELKNTINTMVDQLRSFADEVTRVAGEVGTAGILGGQAQVRGVSGTWRELTDNVNLMARNLTQQVRGIARVVTAVANGDLKQELRLDSKGEIATLVETINNMIITLSTFADQVSGVARDVGVEGRLGGQADVPGAAGIWRDLTNNVNELAGNLTRQVRAIGDVATAVTKGDLTRTIDVEAKGEVAVLKDNINQMIGTLARTTKVNEEQDWLKTNLTRFTQMLQGQRDLSTVANQVLSELAPVVHVQHGCFYMASHDEEGEPKLDLYATYAHVNRKQLAHRYAFGESLVGQAAIEKKPIVVHDVPQDYVVVSSALGEAPPRSIVVVPILFEGEVKGVIELASIVSFTENELALINQLRDSLGIVIATIEATMRTDELLRRSQGMAEALQMQQDELRQTNEELEEKARQLTEQRDEVELKNREVEHAKQALEEKAAQLALTSKYKSQFLANMSHELRTPLNSLLILSRRLADNRQGHLDDAEIEYVRTIHDAGSDLMELIDEILDLAKVESGTMAVRVGDVELAALLEDLERSFSQVAEDRSLGFAIELTDDAPAHIVTDEMRLRQVLRNLLSNAFKFTHEGGVTIRAERASVGWSSGHEVLESADTVVAFRVIDTGIGIPEEEQQIIFEAFQQSDGGTSRRYRGTGLGLSISRELAMLLGGELKVDSHPGQGSTFTLFLPSQHVSARTSAPPSQSTLASRIDSHAEDTRFEANRAVDGENGAAPGNGNGSGARHVDQGERLLLFIDDDLELAERLQKTGRMRQWRGVVAPTGRAGLAMVRQLDPQAISVDTTLPDVDVGEFVEQLKEEAWVPIFLTGEGTEERARELGASGFLDKPLDTGKLEKLLEKAEASLRESAPSGTTTLSGKKVLLVDDDVRNLFALTTVLEAEGIQVVCAENGRQAIECLSEDGEVDAVLMDVMMPEMDGFEATRRIREDLRRANLPIIMLTAKAMRGDREQCLAFGASEYVTKPVDPDKLLTVLREWIRDEGLS